MQQALCIGVYDPSLIHQASPMCGDNVFAKGLERNGYDVIKLDYRAIEPNNYIRNFNDSLNPSIIWLGKCEKVFPETITLLRKKYPNAVIVKWAADVRNEPSVHDTALLKAGVDWFFGTFGGEYLKKHLFPGMTGVASIFTFTDSEYYLPKEVDEAYRSDILWTGRRGFGDNLLRNEIISHFDAVIHEQQKKITDEKTLKIKLFGHDGRRWLGNPEYVNYINGTKIGIGSNSFNRPKYSSDRLGNYMSCGTFYLTQYVEGIETIFERGVDLDWFHDITELDEKIMYYLKNETIRNKLAQRGRMKILKYFDCRPLVKTLLDIIETNEKQHAWEDVYLGANKNICKT